MRKDKKEKKSTKSTKSLKKRRPESVPIERLQIPVQRYDAEVFRMLIQFIHSGTAYITVENVSGNFSTLSILFEDKFSSFLCFKKKKKKQKYSTIVLYKEV